MFGGEGVVEGRDCFAWAAPVGVDYLNVRCQLWLPQGRRGGEGKRGMDGAALQSATTTFEELRRRLNSAAEEMRTVFDILCCIDSVVQGYLDRTMVQDEVRSW